MRTSERFWRFARDFAGVLPRACAGLKHSEGWNLASPSGIRLLGEVLMDESALTGMTLAASPPKLERTVDSCTAAAEELTALGVAGAYVQPEPLRVKAIRRRLIVGAWHDRMALREPALALHERWGGELYWHDGSHAGNLLFRRVQATSERFLAGLSAGGGRRLFG